MALNAPAMFTQGAGFTFGGGAAGSGPPGSNTGSASRRRSMSSGISWPTSPAGRAGTRSTPKAAGELRIGEILELTVALPGEPHRQIEPVIFDWTPNDQIHWRLSMMGGLVRSVRFLELEVLGDASCIFSNGELFSGLLGGMVVNSKRRAIRKGFTAMGEALAAKAEATWQARGGAPTSNP